MNKGLNKLKAFAVIFFIAQVVALIVMRFRFLSRESVSIAEQIPVSFGLGVGLALTIYCCYLYVLAAIEDEKIVNRYKLPLVASAVATVIVLPVGLAIGVLGGGAFAGGWMQVLFEFLHLNLTVGMSLGIGIGIFIGAVIPTLLGTITGFHMGLVVIKWLEGNK